MSNPNNRPGSRSRLQPPSSRPTPCQSQCSQSTLSSRPSSGGLQRASVSGQRSCPASQRPSLTGLQRPLGATSQRTVAAGRNAPCGQRPPSAREQVSASRSGTAKITVTTTASKQNPNVHQTRIVVKGTKMKSSDKPGKCVGPCTSGPPIPPFTEDVERGRPVPPGRYYIPVVGKADTNLPEDEKKLRQKLQKYTPTSLSHWKVEYKDPFMKPVGPLRQQHPDVVSGMFTSARGQYEPDHANQMLEQRLDPSYPQEMWSMSLQEAMSHVEEVVDYDDDSDDEADDYEDERPSGVCPGAQPAQMSPRAPSPAVCPGSSAQPARRSPSPGRYVVARTLPPSPPACPGSAVQAQAPPRAPSPGPSQRTPRRAPCICSSSSSQSASPAPSPARSPPRAARAPCSSPQPAPQAASPARSTPRAAPGPCTVCPSPSSSPQATKSTPIDISYPKSPPVQVPRPAASTDQVSRPSSRAPRSKTPPCGVCPGPQARKPIVISYPQSPPVQVPRPPPSPGVARAMTPQRSPGVCPGSKSPARESPEMRRQPPSPVTCPGTPGLYPGSQTSARTPIVISYPKSLQVQVPRPASSTGEITDPCESQATPRNIPQDIPRDRCIGVCPGSDKASPESQPYTPSLAKQTQSPCFSPPSRRQRTPPARTSPEYPSYPPSARRESQSPGVCPGASAPQTRRTPSPVICPGTASSPSSPIVISYPQSPPVKVPRPTSSSGEVSSPCPGAARVRTPRARTPSESPPYRQPPSPVACPGTPGLYPDTQTSPNTPIVISYPKALQVQVPRPVSSTGEIPDPCAKKATPRDIPRDRCIGVCPGSQTSPGRASPESPAYTPGLRTQSQSPCYSPNMPSQRTPARVAAYTPSLEREAQSPCYSPSLARQRTPPARAPPVQVSVRTSPSTPGRPGSRASSRSRIIISVSPQAQVRQPSPSTGEGSCPCSDAPKQTSTSPPVQVPRPAPTSPPVQGSSPCPGAARAQSPGVRPDEETSRTPIVISYPKSPPKQVRRPSASPGQASTPGAARVRTPVRGVCPGAQTSRSPIAVSYAKSPPVQVRRPVSSPRQASSPCPGARTPPRAEASSRSPIIISYPKSPPVQVPRPAPSPGQSSSPCPGAARVSTPQRVGVCPGSRTPPGRASPPYTPGLRRPQSPYYTPIARQRTPPARVSPEYAAYTPSLMRQPQSPYYTPSMVRQRTPEYAQSPHYTRQRTPPAYTQYSPQYRPYTPSMLREPESPYYSPRTPPPRTPERRPYTPTLIREPQSPYYTPSMVRQRTPEYTQHRPQTAYGRVPEIRIEEATPPREEAPSTRSVGSPALSPSLTEQGTSTSAPLVIPPCVGPSGTTCSSRSAMTRSSLSPSQVPLPATPIPLSSGVRVPSSPQDATADIVRRLVAEERQDVNINSELPPDLIKKINKMKLKPQSVRALEETLNESIPIEDENEKLESDDIALLLYSQETGAIDTSSSPRKTFDHLFPPLEDEAPMTVSAAAPAPLADIVVPIGEAAAVEVAIINEEIVLVSTDANVTPGGIPEANIFAEVVKNDTTLQSSLPRQRTSEVPPVEDGEYVPHMNLDEEKPPWMIDLSSLENLVGGKLSGADGGDNMPSDESLRARAGRIEYLLDVQKPLYYSCVQLRGSQMPAWFPGYYSVLPHVDGHIRLERSPSRAFAAAWNVLAPYQQAQQSEVLVL